MYSNRHVNRQHVYLKCNNRFWDTGQNYSTMKYRSTVTKTCKYMYQQYNVIWDIQVKNIKNENPSNIDQDVVQNHWTMKRYSMWPSSNMRSHAINNHPYNEEIHQSHIVVIVVFQDIQHFSVICHVKLKNLPEIMKICRCSRYLEKILDHEMQSMTTKLIRVICLVKLDNHPQISRLQIKLT